MLKVGIDIIGFARVERLLKNNEEGVCKRVLTPKEKESFVASTFKQKTIYLAQKIASKEAFFKAIGTGIISFKEVEILRSPQGKYIINVYGKTREVFESLNCKAYDVSISYDGNIAIAICIVEL